MKLIEIVDQYRRDFKGIYECENCGEKEKHNGYDDDNYHNNVIPNLSCGKCGKTSKDMGIVNKVKTKYESREVV